MSSTSTIKAVSVAQLAAKANKALYAQPNTPLELIARSNFSGTWNFDYLNNSSDEEQAGGIAAAIGVVGESDIIGDAQLAAFIEQISSSVQNHINYSKNVVLPELKEFVKIVSERMSVPQSILSGFNIVVSDLPEPMLNTGFKKRIADFQGGTYANPTVRMYLPVPENAVEALFTGSNDFDESIKLWANTITADKVAAMWKDVYTDQGRAMNLIELFETGSPDGVNYALFVWLSMSHMVENIPEGVAYTLQEFQRFSGQYLEAAAIRIQKEYNTDETFNNAKLMIMGQNKYSNQLTVNGPVYREFVKNGGKNEALLGGMLGDNLGKTLGEIETKSGEYFAEYERNEALAQALRRNNSFNEFKSALIWAISSLQYDNLSQEEQGAWTEMGINVPAIIARAQVIVDELSIPDMENVHATCMKVLCRSRYQYTDSETFLTSMESAMKANPSMDVREAGLVATIEMIGDYLADMIVVRNV